MKAYVTLPAVAAASAEDIAGRCGVSQAAARAVRAAAKLALEDQAATQRRLASGKRRGSQDQDKAYRVDEGIAFLAAEAAEEFGEDSK
jgi:excinuclease ABC subunit C